MKKSITILLLSALIATFIPVRASRGDLVMQDSHLVFLPMMVRLEKTGQRLDIFESGSQTFPASTPFHIVHGWKLDLGDDQVDLFDFQVSVDGVYRELDFIEAYVDTNLDPPVLTRRFVYNFPEGMTGTHLFIGHWIAPCYAFYDDCEDPDELYELISIVDVTFIS